MTPAYAARELWDIHFSDLGLADAVIEPTCGDGRMLQAVPVHIPAFGVEIDPILADAARERTGRHIITGSILEVEFPQKFNVVFGNLPFRSKLMDGLLERLAEEMDDGLRCGVIVPAYFMQTPSRVLRWNRDWSMSAELLPRTLWPRLMRPIVFALFTKDPVPKLTGLRLYAQCDAVTKMPAEFQEMMISGRGMWRDVVARSLQKVGGKAHVQEIYKVVEGKRPTQNPFWREKVRQVLQRGPFKSHGEGVWSLAA